MSTWKTNYKSGQFFKRILSTILTNKFWKRPQSGKKCERQELLLF